MGERLRDKLHTYQTQRYLSQVGANIHTVNTPVLYDIHSKDSNQAWKNVLPRESTKGLYDSSPKLRSQIKI